MKIWAGYAALAGALIVGSTAHADDQSTLGVNLPPETSADAVGEPEWYRQFAFTSDEGTEIVLSETPNDSWGLEFGAGEKWSVRIDRIRRTGLNDLSSPLPREEVSAEAMFQVTPRISFGGEVSVGADSLDAEGLGDLNENGVEAGIRLRSAFRF